jgi:hypothetical protein
VRWPSIRRAGSYVVIMSIITIALFMLVEGAISVAYSFYVFFIRPTGFMEEEQVHAEYDAELGWVNKPNLVLPDLYGRGVGFRSNSQRFRANRDYPPEPPPGVTRVICSGDSFTMGHSVADDVNWCALLGRDVPGIETVNMGMAAYGLDQAYLWYRRDGAPLQHHLQVLAFITPDFDRVAYDNFGGYPKPYLQIVNGRLEAMNVPVPRMFDAVPRLRRRREALMNLSMVRHGRAALESLGISPGALPGRLYDDEQVKAVAARIFEELRGLNAAKQSRLVLVYLPRTGDRDDRASDPWRVFVQGEATRLGLPFIDLVEEFRKLPLDDGERFFAIPYQPSHYNVSGNAWVARQLRTRLFTPAGPVNETTTGAVARRGTDAPPRVTARPAARVAG